MSESQCFTSRSFEPGCLIMFILLVEQLNKEKSKNNAWDGLLLKYKHVNFCFERSWLFGLVDNS